VTIAIRPSSGTRQRAYTTDLGRTASVISEIPKFNRVCLFTDLELKRSAGGRNGANDPYRPVGSLCQRVAPSAPDDNSAIPITSPCMRSR
jgi:hypothetical protein